MNTLGPMLASFLPLLLLCRICVCQYSSDQCSWKGSGLTHEGHTRDVEQVYLRCSQGSLEWLYPTGAIIVNLRPNTISPASARLSVCIKPSKDSTGTNIYLDRNGRLRLLLREEDQAQGKVHCFSMQEGALFIEAVQHMDISRRITAFQYELVSDKLRAEALSPSAPCQPCSDAEMLLEVCTNDFVARGSIRNVDQKDDYASVTVEISRLHRQKTQVFAPGGVRVRSWTGNIKMPLQCKVKSGEGEFLFTGTVRFGEAWMGCAPRYKDFLRLYHQAQLQGTNPCHVDTD
ncbi:meteorin-like protein [Nothobranchius furzeri]|uniref:Meteorin-like protein n=2 Tax=Nothobranchius furzeri TaxID=105023 RepID=A0A1A7ZEQ3_NOTFU|nr:meteorin-like protein [Nothobranchius furzeri]KAF7225519.1 glial cell differentiation regulator-like [Nothobranchius furzeri]